MRDREKVIKGLDVCLKNIDQQDCPNDCPYFSDCSEYENRVVFQPLMRDALALLKEDCHNCKLECLLQKYDELKEKYDKLLKEHESTTFKPHYIDEYGTHFIYGVECGSCHEKISRTYHYCPYCGKAVKWNE